MSILTFLMLACVMGSGAYMMMSSHYCEALFGIALTSNGINLLLIESSQPLNEAVDPLPQALILTAIVIGFGVLAFMAAFILHCIKLTGSDEVSSIKEEEF